MGESKRRIKRLSDMVAADPWCIYCPDPATTADHMPPTAMFTPFRPNEMVFPSCLACNSGTRQSDQVASFFSTISLNDLTPDVLALFRRLLSGVSNNVPGFIDEIRMPAAAHKFALQRARLPPEAGILKVDGPIASYHMERFAAKLGFAMHYEKTLNRVGPAGGVAFRWYSNANIINDNVLEYAESRFWGPETLRQGRQHASDRFEYRWVTDGHATGVLARFGTGFAVLALACDDIGRLHEITGGFAGTVRSGCFRN